MWYQTPWLGLLVAQDYHMLQILGPWNHAELFVEVRQESNETGAIYFFLFNIYL